MLGTMSEPSTEAEEYPAGARAVAKYTPDEETHPGDVSLPGYLGAVPSLVAAGGIFTFDAAFVEELAGQAEFDVAGVLDLSDEGDRALRAEIESIVDTIVVPAELRQADEVAAEVEEAAPEKLKGEALDDAARAAGIPTSLSADEKRAALADLEPVEPVAPVEPTENPPLEAAPAGEPVVDTAPEGEHA